MTLQGNRRLTNKERAVQLYVKDKVIAPLSKRGKLINPEFRGAAKEIQTATDKYIAVSGVARAGKSLAILWKMNQLAMEYPGMRGLIVRKTRESLNESALVTFERDVLGEGNPVIPGGQRNSRHNYNYSNGSTIAVRGLLASGKDASAQVMSSEYDMIFVQEATELKESEYGQLTTRLSNYRVPFQQIVLDCNPDSPNHWIWRHHLGNKIRLLHSILTDNPKWWVINPSEKDGGHWTREGADVYDTLSKLTGIQKERLFLGKWVQATGLVYPEWDDTSLDGNVTEKAEYIPDGGDVWWGIDDGYAGEYDEEVGNFTPTSHPRAFWLCQLRADGTVCVFNESAKIKTLSARHIKEVQEMGYTVKKEDGTEELVKYPEPYRVVVDKSAAELIGALKEDYGNNVLNQKIVNVEEGIKLLRDYIAPDENKVRKLLVHPRCKFTQLNFSSYKRDDKGNIVKEEDHFPDLGRYLISVIANQPKPNFRTLG